MNTARLVLPMLLLGLSIPAVAAEPAPERFTVVVLPPAGDSPEAQNLAYVIQARASAILANSGRYNELNLRQILGMAERHGMTPAMLGDANTATQAAHHLGATRFIYGKLSAQKAGWRLEYGSEAAGAASESLIELSFGDGHAVDVAGGALAKALAKLDGITLQPKQLQVAPLSRSDKAMSSYLTCHGILVRQSLGIESPTVLDEEEIRHATDACRSAVEQDKSFSGAWAALGFAQALAGDDAAAVEALTKVKADGDYNPLYWVARFWLLTRYESNDAGLQVLREALRRHPGMLLARGYLAESLNALGRHQEALAVWEEYAKQAPSNGFVVGKVGYTLARLGKHDQAIAKTKDALKMDPKSVDLQMELGSRYIDAGKAKDAVKVLEPLAALADARGELLLRLGYAYQLTNNQAKAMEYFTKGVEKAQKASEWRTRARGKYNLARLALLKGDKALAKRLVIEAAWEGYRPKTPDPKMQSLMAEYEREGLTVDAGTEGTASLEPKVSLKETTPFSLDSAGMVDPNKPKAPPPAGIEVLRFQGP